jgi:hypothetical protein
MFYFEASEAGIYSAGKFCIIEVQPEVAISDFSFGFQQEIPDLVSWAAIGCPSIGIVGMVVNIRSEDLQTDLVFFHPDHGSDQSVSQRRGFCHFGRNLFPEEIMIFHHLLPVEIGVELTAAFRN